MSSMQIVALRFWNDSATVLPPLRMKDSVHLGKCGSALNSRRTVNRHSATSDTPQAISSAGAVAAASPPPPVHDATRTSGSVISTSRQAGAQFHRLAAISSSAFSAAMAWALGVGWKPSENM